MNIKNIALVRATNVIPFDGIVRPVSEVPYLESEKESAFCFAIYDLLKKQGKLKEIDYSKSETEIKEIQEQNNKIVEQYMPYNSKYNSMVLWALNGIVPDDNSKGGYGPNIFSNKDCAIIEALEEQLDKSEIISLVATDTAIKGNVELSNQSIILLSKERYESLSQEEKDKLSSLDLKLEIFEGDLTGAINKTLQESGRYTAETLSLAREDKEGFIHSETSDELIETINKIARENGIAQELHINVVRRQSDYLDKLNSVKNEFDNMVMVEEFYKLTFFEYLFSKMDISDMLKAEVMYAPDSYVYMEQLSDEIEENGIDEYKKIVDTYNHSLEQLKERGKLPTPQQIVDATREKRKIDLISMVEEVEKESQENGRTVSVGEVGEVVGSISTTKRNEAIDELLSSTEEKIQEGTSHNGE